MGKAVWMKNVPWYIWVCGTILVGFLIAAFTVLAITNSDTTDLWQFINRSSNIVGAIFGITGTGAAIAAARSSHQAAEQTNGTMKPTMKAAVAEALDERAQAPE